MRTIKRIVVHCSATPAGRPFTIDDIWRWHTDPRPYGNGWRNGGYHYVVHLDGAVHVMEPLAKPSNGARGFNAGSIHLCYIGGMSRDGQRPEDTRTRAQKRALHALVKKLQLDFDVPVVGHNDLDPGKACPSFNVEP